MNLVVRLLERDPNKRISAKEALKSEFFKERKVRMSERRRR